jgi:arylsulfatase A-like enzyme
MEDPARRSYAAVVTTTDHYIGQIIDKLENLSLRHNTVVIFMSDNGHSEETFMRIKMDGHRSGLPQGHLYAASGAGNTGKWIGQKTSFLEGGIRVPAIISHPAKLPQGAVRDQIITAMDWFPTVLALCDIKAPSDAPRLDGHNLLPLIANPTAPSAYGGVLHFAWSGQWAVREGDWKLIGKGRGDSGEQEISLHRLADPQPEANDYLLEKPEVAARLRAMHEKWLAGVTAPPD